MDVLTVAAVFCLLSVSAAKPQNCESLIQPLALNKTQISGHWIFIAGTSDHQKYTDILKTVNSSSMDIVQSSDEDTFAMTQKNMIDGECQYLYLNISLSDNTLNITNENCVKTSCIMLPACPNCLVLLGTSWDGEDIIKSLYIFGRTKKLNQPDFEMYQDQIECLGFPQPSFKYDQKQDICPDKEKHAGTEEEKQ